MKRFVLVAALAVVGLRALPADAGVAVQIGSPGFYGTIDVGGFPQPELIYAQPIIVQPVPVARQPIYLHVPPGHAKHWSKHCGKYGACGQPVYFVQNGWYNDVYVPRYRELHGGHPGKSKGHDDD
jgi:hypothetical protein